MKVCSSCNELVKKYPCSECGMDPRKDMRKDE